MNHKKKEFLYEHWNFYFFNSFLTFSFTQNSSINSAFYWHKMQVILTLSLQFHTTMLHPDDYLTTPYQLQCDSVEWDNALKRKSKNGPRLFQGTVLASAWKIFENHENS